MNARPIVEHRSYGEYVVTLGSAWRVLLDAVRKRQRKAEKRLREFRRTTSPQAKDET